MTIYQKEEWHVAPHVIDEEIIILNDCDAVIASVPLWKNEELEDGLKEQSKCNAALIAAAPDLWEAAQLADDALSVLSCIEI